MSEKQSHLSQNILVPNKPYEPQMTLEEAMDTCVNIPELRKQVEEFKNKITKNAKK